MSQSNDELAEQLKQTLDATGLPVALDGGNNANGAEENPLDTDFFRALNAFRAARTANDREAMAAAEEHLREVVRGELTHS